VVLGLDARRVRIVAAPALTFTLAPQTPHVSTGARVGVPALALQLTQHAPLILTSLPAANLTLAANAPTVSAGVAIAAPPTGIALVAEPPQRAGPRPTTVSAPLAGFSVSPTAPTVATGVSVSPAALALEISAVAPDVVAFDADAAAYIAAVEAADAQTLELAVKTVYNDFVVGCKSDGIWNAIKASCILAGARTLTGALTPLVGTAPTSFNFVDGDYDRKTGLGQQGSSSKWLDSNYLNNADSRQNNNHQAVFTHSYSTSAFLLGDSFNTGGNSALSTGGTNVGATRNMQSAPSTPVDAALQNGKLFGSARQASGSYIARVNGSGYTVSQASSAPTPHTIGLFRLSQTSDFASTSARIQFYSIGNFLDLALLDTRVSTLISAIDAAIA
jgi:hypothetical protein